MSVRITTWNVVKPLLPQIDMSAIANPNPKPIQKEDVKRIEEPAANNKPIPDVVPVERKRMAIVQSETIISESYEEELKKRDGRLMNTIKIREDELTITTTFIKQLSISLIHSIDTTDIKCISKQGRVHFLVTLVNEKALMMCSNINFLAVYTNECLHVYNLAGIAITEPFCVPNVCFLECNQFFSLLALQITGELFLWNLNTRVLILRTNVLQLFPKLNHDCLTKAFVDNFNNVLLNTRRGKVYRYDFEFGVFKKAKDIKMDTKRASIELQNVMPRSEISNLLFGNEGKFAEYPEFDERHKYQYDTNALEEKLMTAKALRLPEYWLLFGRYILLLVESKNYEKFKRLCIELVDLNNGTVTGCTMINATEEEKKEKKLMGKPIGQVIKEEVIGLINGCTDQNVLAILSRLQALF